MRGFVILGVKMGDAKWPAIAIQSIFLASNIAYLLAGKNDLFIMASTSVIVFHFTIQSLSDNPRFMYLFPVNIPTGIKIPGWDTWILRGSIVLSVLLFYIGATGLYILPCIIVAFGLGFPFVWDKYIEEIIVIKKKMKTLFSD
jgi:hypothetical protein